MTDLDEEAIDTTIVAAAQALADDVLFPGALETDEADVLPVERLDALAEAGFYGLFAPPELGGLGANGPTMTAAVEAISSGCLTTSLVWCQHFGLLGNVVFGSDAMRERYAEDAARGRVRGGIAFGGLLPGPPILTATRVEGGWTLQGRAPWVSGWGRIDLVHVAARGPDDTVVNVLIDAAERDGVRAERLRLAAVDASATVHLTFEGLVVPEDCVLSVQPYDPAREPRRELALERLPRARRGGTMLHAHRARVHSTSSSTARATRSTPHQLTRWRPNGPARRPSPCRQPRHWWRTSGAGRSSARSTPSASPVKPSSC